MNTLKSYSNFIQHDFMNVQILYDPLNSTVMSSLTMISSVLTTPFNRFTTIQLIPVGVADLSGCKEDSCMLQKALLCSSLNLDPWHVLMVQRCILQSSLSVDKAVRRCGANWGVFPLSILKCMEYPWVNQLAMNVTLAAQQAVRPISHSRVMTDLAALEDELLEAEVGDDELEVEVEVESDDTLLMNESNRLVSSLMPLAVLVDGKLKRENESLIDFVCENVVGSKPLVCREWDPIPSRQLEHDVKMDIYLNIYCTANEPVLSPFMQWVTSDPE